VRLDLVRWGGLAAVILGLLFVFRLLGEALAGANVVGDDAAVFLQDLDGGGSQAAVTTAVLAIFLSPLALFPMLLGLIYAVDERRRPIAMLAAAMMAFGAVLLVVAFAFFGSLLAISDAFVDTTVALRDPLAEDGQQAARMFNLLLIAGYTITGGGVLLFGRLLWSSEIAPRWIAWVTLLTGLAMLLFIFAAPAVYFAHPLWLLLLGWQLYTRANTRITAELARQQFARPS
jgi:hypothetical protein